ncbi:MULTISPECIES: hypothetical protein [Enterobacteriaceae]|uniref:hypothetical protein n=1 Tax=Enterobacteriaceae TaxID=543 RepID=UPI000B40F9A3|nr:MULTISPECIES: hypothetical protein [Enterobacteriaceae]EAA5946193.1 hypothetical protein [Salmonella enterica subsp. enterica serovar Isangi]EDW4882005.1 hypothetical protein [Salmonella enterica subsp. enterica]HCB4454462.1 hypothetical protein [Salmonella enterica]HDC4492916.1 hypothetical protein [Enterobacter asburiae]HDC4625297.1 hypothetical protein [Enterobacter kobei]
MAKNPISNKADNDRIQIRSFWISERKAPYVYSFLKKTELSHRGDQLDLIRSAISTGLVLNNLFPDLANFINGLNERLTLADLNRFLNDVNTIDTEPKPPINVLLENVLDQKFKEYLTPLQLDNSKQDSVSVKETFLVQKEHACLGVKIENEGSDTSIPSESPLSSDASKIPKEKSISAVVPVLEKVSDENQTASISIKSKAKANKRLATLAR